MAVLQGNVDNNNANIARIEEELQGAEDRSGGITAQMEQTQSRIAEIDRDLAQKRQGLDEIQHELTALTASAQGLTRQFLELRGKETSLAADIAGREADNRGLTDSLAENETRLQQLKDEGRVVADVDDKNKTITFKWAEG
jgi:chromosome segregation ATPase